MPSLKKLALGALAVVAVTIWCWYVTGVILFEAFHATGPRGDMLLGCTILMIVLCLLITGWARDTLKDEIRPNWRKAWAAWRRQRRIEQALRLAFDDEAAFEDSPVEW